MNQPLVTLQRVLQNPDAVTSGKGNDLGHCGVDGKQKSSRRGPGLETRSLDACPALEYAHGWVPLSPFTLL